MVRRMGTRVLLATCWALLGSAQAQETAPESRDRDEEAEPAEQTSTEFELLPTIPVPADETAVTPTEDRGGSTTIDEIVVTASRREQSIDRVPIAVSEVSGVALEAAAVRDTQSLVMVAPSLNIQFSGSEANATLRIRGIGTGGSNGGFESSVGVFVDGVYLPRPGLALNDLLDLERVEVLRGPQGTLFGKNTTVGAIQILTRQPSFEPEGSGSVFLGNYNSRIARATLSGPVIDDLLAVRLSGQYNQREGYVTNLFNAEQYNDRDRYILRGQGLLTPTPDLSLRLIGTTIRKNERCCVAPFTQYNPATADNIRDHGGTVFEPPAEYTVAFDYVDTFSNAGEDSVSVHLDWTLGDLGVKTLVSYAEGFAEDARDGDFADIDFAFQPFVNAQTRIATAEISLQSSWGPLDWLAGVFYSDEAIGVQAQTLIGEEAGSFLLGNGVPPGTPVPLFPANSGNLATALQDGVSASLFTHNVLRLGGGFEVTLGLRYLRERKTGGGEATSNSPSCAIPLVPGGTIPSLPGVTDPTRTTNSLRVLCAADPYRERYTDQRLTGTVSLGRNFESGLYAYLGYSQGFKSGGINLNPVSTVGGTFQFEPEEIDNYELGVRLPLFDGALRLRATAFFMDLKNYQLNAFDGTAFSVSNAGAVEAQGVELESTLRLFESLNLRGNFTFTDTVYAPGTRDQSLIGKQLTNSPERVGQISLNYLGPRRGAYSVFGSVTARYQSEVNTGVDLDSAKAQEAYTLVNARLGLKLRDRYELALTGQNLTDAYYSQIIFNSVTRPPVGANAQPGSFNGYPGTPRMYGIELRARF